MAEGRKEVQFKVEDLTVYVVGDDKLGAEEQEKPGNTKKKYVMITFHDVGMDHKTCFEQFLKHKDIESLNEDFIIYHIDAPGQEPDAVGLAKNYQYPSIEELANLVGNVIDKWKLEDVICFGVGAGANVMAYLTISKWADKIKGAILVEPGISVAAETLKTSKNVGAFKKSFQESCKNSDLLEKIKSSDIKPSVLIVSGKDSKKKVHADDLHRALNPQDSNKFQILYVDCGDNVLEKRPECMARRIQSFIGECGLRPLGDQQQSWVQRRAVPIAAVGVGVLGAVGAVAAAPVVLTAAGFTSAGIAASSFAASLMSASAIANGGGVVAGGLVATLQSVGAAGLGAAGTAAVGGAGAGVGVGIGAGVTSLFKKVFGN